MNGILCIDKPDGFTSFDVVAKMRGIAKTKKIGHGGTLDPMATGVLPLFFGIATKASNIVPDQDKAYIATFVLGITTDTLDITGDITQKREVKATKTDVLNAADKFKGKISQLPPMYSAVHINGVRLYDLARSGVKDIEREPRNIEIYSLELIECDEAKHEYTIEVACSKGSYIRSLCNDIGEVLGCGATLTQLRRTVACGYSLANCITIEQAQVLANTGMLEQKLLPVETAFLKYSKLILDEKNSKMLQNGVKIPVSTLDMPNNLSNIISAYGPDNLFLGLVEINEDKLKINRLFSRGT